MGNIISFKEIFNNSIFRIPDYQRGYSWTQKELGELTTKQSKEKLKLSDEDKFKTRDLMMRDIMTSYGREVMKAYASNFDREINGKKISENDLMYYGRVETKRSYSIKDKQVIRNKELLKKLRIRMI